MTEIDTIREFIAKQFLPDVDPAKIAADFDLIESGTVDSLGLLRVISWLTNHYEMSLDGIPIEPDQFRTVGAIDRFVTEAKGTTTSVPSR